MKDTLDILKEAKAAKSAFLALSTEEKNEALLKIAASLVENCDIILEENKKDVESAKGVISEVMIDRLALSRERIDAMADGIKAVAVLPDPVGRVLSRTKRPNGLVIEKTTVPIGVVAIIYESRPNVTSDAAALSLKSGNVCVLRSGKEAFRSARAIVESMRDGLSRCDLPRTLINLVEDTSRESAKTLMTAVGFVDLLIPRGGAGLIKACVENAKVPCIETGTGICHIFVEKTADFDMALNIIENAKAQRPSVCNAAEVLLVDRDIKTEFLPLLKERLYNKRKENKLPPVELVLDSEAAEIIDGTIADETSFDTEFLDYKMAVAVVDGVCGAVSHIEKHSTRHSEAVITSDSTVASVFTSLVDSAAVYVNASTRFTDGGEFGLGCEMGISTGRLHPRGPMGLSELTAYKYIIKGNGQIR